MARYITGTLPPSVIVDGAGGGDVVFRELSLGEYLDADRVDRIGLALHSFRGARAPVGATLEEWVRKLSPAAGQIFADAVTQIHNPTPEQQKAFKASHRVDETGHSWTLPSSALDEGDARILVSMRQLTFGECEDALATTRAAKSKTPAYLLTAKAAGMTERAVRDLPARAGVLLMSAYNEIHNATEEESAGFLGSLAASTTPPKAI